MNLNCGDVCLAHFPFTDGTSSKLRPVLVISDSRFNREEDVVVLPISSRPHPDDTYAIFVGPSEYAAAGLRMPSSVKWTKPMTISKNVLTRRLGRLPDNLLREVLEKLVTLFDPQA